MTLIRRSNDLFPTFFDDFFGKDWFFNNNLTPDVSTPSVNIIENDEGYRVEMAAPGMKKKDFNVELNQDTLTISYEREENKETKNDDSKYTKREFNYQSFSRSFVLPNTVAADKIGANYVDGILTLTIPKKEEVKRKPTRLIAVS